MPATDLNEALGARLRALPVFEPPPGGWERLGLRAAVRRRMRIAAAGGGLALAASLLLAVGVMLRTPEPTRAVGPSSPSQRVAMLRNQSSQLEAQLAVARHQVPVWDAMRAARADTLEGGLSVVDLQLNYADDAQQAERLWRSRVQLMGELVALHRGAAPGLQTASWQYPGHAEPL